MRQLAGRPKRRLQRCRPPMMNRLWLAGLLAIAGLTLFLWIVMGGGVAPEAASVRKRTAGAERRAAP
jgi:hypothetical protein